MVVPSTVLLLSNAVVSPRKLVSRGDVDISALAEVATTVITDAELAGRAIVVGSEVEVLICDVGSAREEVG